MSTVTVTVQFDSPYEAQLGLAVLGMLKYAESPHPEAGIANDRALALFPAAIESMAELLGYLTPQLWAALPWTRAQHERIAAIFQVKHLE